MSFKTLQSQALKLWHDISMQQHNYICQSCGQTATQTHHFFFKGTFPHLKYELLNGVPLCRECHYLLHIKDGKLIEKQIINNKGQKWHNKLEKMAYIKPLPKCPRTVGYLQEKITILKINETNRRTAK